MLSLLTKSQILQGVKYTEELAIPELGGSVKIRAISDGEFTEIETEYIRLLAKLDVDVSTLQGLQQGNTAIKINFTQSSEINLASKRRAWAIAAKALSIGSDDWSVDEIKALPTGIVDKIVVKAEELSRGKPNQVESFRDDSIGTDAGVSLPSGISIDGEPAGIDNATTIVSGNGE